MELVVTIPITITRNLNKEEVGRTVDAGPDTLDTIKKAFQAYMLGEFFKAVRDMQLLEAFETEFHSQWEEMIRVNFPDAQHEASVPR